MMNLPILSTLVVLPILASLILLIYPLKTAASIRHAKVFALLVSLGVFGLSVQLWMDFVPSTNGFQFVESYSWLTGFPARIKLGVDGLSVFFVLLSTFLIPICLLASWESIESRVKEYLIAFLVLEAMMIGMFASLDLVLFYVFFEGVLIPMFLIIGVWGGDNRVYASYKFFLYTLAGSVLMLIAVIYMVTVSNTSDIPTLMTYPFAKDVQPWLWFALFASFAVKVPMWPVHTWLPDAHVQAPTAGSVILAGVLLKMGGYGFLRLSLPMLPYATHMMTPLMFGLSLVGIIYTSFVALAQEDMKKLIAYSSVAHMGFVTLGIFTFNLQGVSGAVLQMISHGVVSGALFLCVGVVYDRLHTREIAKFGGVASRMPKYAAVFMLFTMATIGLPGTSGFVGEMLVLVGAYQAGSWLAFFAATGVILGAIYSLWLYRRVAFGEITRKEVKALLDMNAREVIVFIPLIVVTLWIGIYPSSFLDIINPAVEHLIHQYQVALVAAGS